MATRRTQTVPSHSSSSSPNDHRASALREGNAQALREQLESLQSNNAARVAALQQELDTLRAEMAAQVRTLGALMGSTPEPDAQAIEEIGQLGARAIASPLVADGANAEGVDTHTPATTTTITSRRRLLKWSGLGAAAALAAAGGASLTSQTAHAASGGNFILGNPNVAEGTTYLSYDGSGNGPFVLDLGVGGHDDTPVVNVLGGNSVNSAVFGVYSAVGNGSQAFGLYGLAGSGGIGVFGFGSGSGGYGVRGESDLGYGVVATSHSGIDLMLNGSGRLWQQVETFVGAPTSGNYNQGEQIRDKNGNLYICVVGGSPGVWKKVAALYSSYNGGAVGFLPSPIRVYDSRHTGGPLVGNATRNVQVTTIDINPAQVPIGATGCIGNLTVTSPTAGGYVVIYPQGSATPTTSTVNFLTGQTVANAFVCGLSGSGQVTVHSFTSGQCQFIVDITGFVA